MKAKRLSLAIVVILLLTLIAPVAQAEGPQLINWDCYIPDEALNHKLHDWLGKDYAAPLDSGELGTLTGTIFLNGLGIKDLTGLGYLTGATGFVLANNEIEELPEFLCETIVEEGVVVLSISGNKLSSLPSILGDSSLTDIYIDFNRFYSIPSCVTEIDTLLSLRAAGNRISSIPSELANMPQLRRVDFRANRLTSIPNSFSGKSFVEFNCNYNFIDFSPGSNSKDVIDSMSVSTLSYERQLKKLDGLSVEYPETGTLKFSWEPGSDIEFGSIFTGKLEQIYILQDGAKIAAISPNLTEYTVSSLEVGTEYEFSFSFDYKILGTNYRYQFTRSYTRIKVTPITVSTAQPTPRPALVSEEESEEVVISEPPTEPEADTAVEDADTPDVVEGEEEGESSEKTEDKAFGGMSTTLIIVLGAVLLLFVIGFAVLLTLLIVKRKAKDKV
ncbi:MAG: hypothetical protein HN389_11275 [Clostridia bacterium]|jgi:hypothetical protein|nr:hypothetical protein [Clostridia bacterium]